MYDSGSVLSELLDSGDAWAAKVLWQVLQLDDATRGQLEGAAAAAAAKALRRPALAKCPQLLHALAMGLSAADRATRAGDRGAAGVALLELAELTCARGKARGLSWWWLTERVLELAAEACTGWRQDGGLCEASVALAHGAFLLYQLRECGESLAKLTLATHISAGQSWATRPHLLRLLPQEYHTPEADSADASQAFQVFQVASRALSEALVQEARAARLEGDHGRASALCREAVERAHDARSPVLELRAERELGDCLLAAGQPAEAIATFRAFLALAHEADSLKDVVEGHIKLALCYNSQRDSEGTHRELREARNAAQELNQPELLSKAHGHLGEFFLNTSRSQYATTHLHLACEYSQRASDKAEADRVRALAGVAGGLELWNSFVTAIRECGADQPAPLRRTRLLQLAAWKDRHAPFWPGNLAVSKAVLQMHAPRAQPPAPEGEEAQETVSERGIGDAEDMIQLEKDDSEGEVQSSNDYSVSV